MIELLSTLSLLALAAIGVGASFHHIEEGKKDDTRKALLLLLLGCAVVLATVGSSIT